MATPAQLKALRQTNRRPTAGSDAFKDEVVQALAAAGVAVTLAPGSAAGPHTLLALLEDRGGSVRLWAIPDEKLEADRAAVERVAGRCFATQFTADLMPEQFAGALLVLVRTGVLVLAGAGDGLYEEIAEAFAADGVEIPSADWTAIAGDVWGGRPVDASLGPIEVTHFIAIHLAM